MSTDTTESPNEVLRKDPRWRARLGVLHRVPAEERNSIVSSQETDPELVGTFRHRPDRVLEKLPGSRLCVAANLAAVSTDFHPSEFVPKFHFSSFGATAYISPHDFEGNPLTNVVPLTCDEARDFLAGAVAILVSLAEGSFTFLIDVSRVPEVQGKLRNMIEKVEAYIPYWPRPDVVDIELGLTGTWVQESWARQLSDLLDDGRDLEDDYAPELAKWRCQSVPELIETLAAQLAREGYRSALSDVDQSLQGLVLFSPAVTKFGTRFAWIESATGLVRTTVLELDALTAANARVRASHPEGHGADVWNGLAQLGEPPFNIGHMVDGTALPDDFYGVATIDSDTVDDVAEAETLIGELLSEAATDRKWSIPHGAMVELEMGAFTHAQLFDFGDIIQALWWTRVGTYVCVEIRLANRTAHVNWFDIHFDGDDDGGREDQTAADRRRAAVELIFAALVRDFLVQEDRRQTFGTSVRKTPPAATTKPKKTGLVTVYLPRTRYTSKANVKGARAELNLQERRAHTVSAHFRRVKGRTERQVAYAKRAGYAVPDGYTFIREHRRGNLQKDVIYRSRSASMILFGGQLQQPSETSWFDFEDRVHLWLKSREMAPQYVLSDARSHGVADFYVSRVASTSVEDLVVRAVQIEGEELDSRLLDSLADLMKSFPAGTLAVLLSDGVATSRFKKKARFFNIEIASIATQ